MDNDPTYVAEVLEGAADALFVHGRCQVVGQDQTGAMCALGAIAYATNRSPRRWQDLVLDNDPVAAALATHLYVAGIAKTDAVDAVYEWNDSTADDGVVIDTLKQCAKHLRNEAHQ